MQTDSNLDDPGTIQVKEKPYRFRISELTFNDGTKVPVEDPIVFVGPNNSGKTRALKDIIALGLADNRGVLVVKEFTIPIPTSFEEFLRYCKLDMHLEENGNFATRTLSATLDQEVHQAWGQSWRQDFERTFHQANNRSQWLTSVFGNHLFAFIKTDRRLRMSNQSASGSHQNQAANLLQMFYNMDRNIELELRAKIKEAFACEITLDFTVPQRLTIRVGKDFSKLPQDPRDARSVLTSEEKLDDQGDGIRSYGGMMICLQVLKRSVFLIDEPEAFLHPPQAFRIGELISDQFKTGKQLVIATHSSDVLSGILASKSKTTIIRIDRIGTRNTFRVLSQERLVALVTDPLLNSARIFDGLFYPGVVVVEADSDARFYHTVSKKLQSSAEFYFVNADNKQTIPKVIMPYREMGVRCVGVVDFDVLNDEKEFAAQLQGFGITGKNYQSALAICKEIRSHIEKGPPEIRFQRLEEGVSELSALVQQVRTVQHGSPDDENRAKDRAVAQARPKLEKLKAETSAWHELKKKGREALPDQLKKRFDELSNICGGAGLFINPCGELESSLAEYGIHWTNDKRDWIVRALTLLPSLEVDASKHPWKFIEAIHKYLLSQATIH
jgi:hypothetical protein